MESSLDRHLIRSSLEDAARQCLDISAMWEAGSAAFRMVDEYSDLDLGFIVSEGANDRVWPIIDGVFEALGGISLRWHEPNPVFSGIDKKTYRLRNAPRWLQVDVGLIPTTGKEFYNAVERHGNIDVIFDYNDRLRSPVWDAEGRLRSMRIVLHHEIMKWRIYHSWFEKELARGRTIDAFRMHYAMTILPLIAVLGMKYRPAQWDFSLRYLHEFMPKEVVDVVERLCYIASPTALPAAFNEAEQLFEQTIKELTETGITPLDIEGNDIGRDNGIRPSF